MSPFAAPVVAPLSTRRTPSFAVTSVAVTPVPAAAELIAEVMPDNVLLVELMTTLKDFVPTLILSVPVPTTVVELPRWPDSSFAPVASCVTASA